MSTNDIRKYLNLFESKRPGDPSEWYKDNPGIGKPKPAAFHSEDYFRVVAEELSNLTKVPIALESYHQANSSEVISFQVTLEDGSKDNIILTLSWRRDGSPSKPLTYFVMGNDDGSEIQYGRFARWDDPKEYARDLVVNDFSYHLEMLNEY